MANRRILSFGLVDERAVFMDLATDSYFTLDAASAQHLHRLLAIGQPLKCDHILFEALGITDQDTDVLRADQPRVSKSMLDQRDGGRPRLADIIRVAQLVRTTRSRLRRLTIERVLQESQASPVDEPSGNAGPEGIILQTDRFLSARKVVPIEQNCLLDSLSLLHWLGPRRSAVTLIFGVKLDPFAAHCWVQSNDLVLNDRVETVAAFTPVRVIRCSAATR